MNLNLMKKIDLISTTWFRHLENVDVLDLSRTSSEPASDESESDEKN